MKIRRASIAVLLTGLCAGSVALAPQAMAAKPGPPTITSIAGYSDGSSTIGGTTFCNFHVITAYSGKAAHGDSITWYLTTGSTTNADSETTSLGPSPTNVSGGFSPAPSPGTYEFIVTIQNKQGTVISQATTSPFQLSGSCPPPGELGTY